VGQWKAEREMEERAAKESTRLSINRIEPQLNELLAVNHEQSKTLAVLVHRTGGVEQRVSDLAVVVDEHGNRLTALESK
jgi:hypothetical protein